MAEFVAGRGTTALDIIGTVLGGLGTLANGTNILGLGSSSTNSASTPFEMTGACMHDVDIAKELMAKDAQIAKLESEKYADSVGLKLYEYVEGQLKAITATQNDKWATQLVVNSNLNGGLSSLNAQQAARVIEGII